MTYPTMARAAAALLLCAPLVTFGEAISTAIPDAPALYSHAMPLTVSGKNAVLQLRLPSAVYLHAASTDLSDLRVFDASGSAVPIALMEPATRAQVQRRELPAAIFPVQARPAPAAHGDLEVRTSDDGAVTSIVTRHDQGTQATSAPLSSLILDFGRQADNQAIDALVFSLPAGVANYQAPVQLEVSDDLRDWNTAGYASLSWLANSEQQTLTSNRMELAPTVFRYARLTWHDGTPLQFASIVAQVPLAGTVTAAQDSITLKPAAGRFPNDLVYAAAPAIPVERMRLAFDGGNVLMPAQIGYYVELPDFRNRQATRWEFRPQLQATFFQMTQNGEQRRSGDVLLGGAHAAQWVLRPASVPAALPSLTLSWTPATLVFMASGRPPYSLYVGRHDARPAARRVSEVAPGFSSAELQGLEHAVAGTMTANSALPPATSDAADAAAAGRMRRALLWAVLLLGVAVLGAMVWKLARQMKDSS